MYVATLLTDPARPLLERVTVESLRNAWGGGDARWLDPGVAAEFAIEAMPDNRWDVWQGLQAMGVDLDKGVLRLSSVHYTSHEDVARLIKALDRHL